jgi:hypothetical protein
MYCVAASKAHAHGAFKMGRRTKRVRCGGGARNWLHSTAKPLRRKVVIDTRILDEVAQSLGKLLPPGVGELKEDFERNARAAVQGALAKMDLVTREEFDVQAALLSRTREKLEALNARVALLEKQLGSDASEADQPSSDAADVDAQ